MWAFAEAGHASSGFFDAIAESVKLRWKDVSCQHFANTVRAFSTAGHASPTLFDAIADEVE
eukprot:3599026-Karenia_brevis.AAC.1